MIVLLYSKLCLNKMKHAIRQNNIMLDPFFLTLGLQIPSKKVFNPLKTPQSTFLEGIWSLRVSLFF